LSQEFDPWRWPPGPGDLSQKCLSLPLSWCHPQKKHNPKLSKFFSPSFLSKFLSKTFQV